MYVIIQPRQDTQCHECMFKIDVSVSNSLLNFIGATDKYIGNPCNLLSLIG